MNIYWFFPIRFYLDDFFDGVLMNIRTPSMQCDLYEKENVKAQINDGILKLEISKKKK